MNIEYNNKYYTCTGSVSIKPGDHTLVGQKYEMLPLCVFIVVLVFLIGFSLGTVAERDRTNRK